MTTKEASSDKKTAGALRSEFSFELHTHFAIKLWEGRHRSSTNNVDDNEQKSQKERWNIISMPVFIGRVTRIHNDALKNNPFADMFLYRIEKSLDESIELLQSELDKAGKWLTQIPAQIHISEVASSEPLDLSVFSRTPLGYKCVWLLVGVDQLAMRAYQAYHYGLISRKKKGDVLAIAGHQVRRAFGIVTLYHSLPISRTNLVKVSEEYQAAVKVMGDLDHDILTGRKRSSFSPPLASLK
ncbi:PFL_4669 family integrating conjugative element protein [Xenorhabdus cabanillasii]|uniref:Integrating conjugative element protein n=1 Tax=Xenorhabdus cabanillasii JM26 TaxID=1427517 RepID=W1J1D3_9GAMM|nr:TIGR03761 family integrating conjugative element protein [Xenorhabdus cabanillasii]PHM75760.1 integrating conjugative element protein [Xenorhabdus cabanillasii JM26]CDL84542.1 conserved hypothetical protein [Xenorhabdus cabanillasii JM26]